VRTASVGGDVASDVRLLSGSRVGRKIQTVLAGEATHTSSGHAGLNFHAPKQWFARADFVQSLEAHNDPTVDRNSAAGVSGSAAADCDRDVVGVSETDGGSYFIGSCRDYNCVRTSGDASRFGLVDLVAGEVAAEDEIHAQYAGEMLSEQ
jgi:hypothetical protein